MLMTQGNAKPVSEEKTLIDILLWINRQQADCSQLITDKQNIPSIFLKSQQNALIKYTKQSQNTLHIRCKLLHVSAPNMKSVL